MKEVRCSAKRAATKLQKSPTGEYSDTHTLKVTKKRLFSIEKFFVADI